MKNLLMLNRCLRFAIVVSVFVAGYAPPSPAEDVKSLAAAVDAHYNHLRSLEAEFTEIYRGSGMDRTEIRNAVAEKTWQDAVGVPFSQREALREQRERRVVLRPDDRQARKEVGEEAGGRAIAPGISAG